MKVGEFEEWMTNLATVSGVPREMLDRTPARVLFALSTAIEERDRAREGRDGQLRTELDRVDNECRSLGCKRKSAYPAPYEPKDPIEEGIRRSQRGKE